MPEEPTLGFEQAFGVLRQFTRSRSAASRAVEHCELCSAALHHDHPQLVELANRQIHCACDARALMFPGRAKSKYKRVSRSSQYLLIVEMTDGQWESLMIPINMSFLF